MFRNQIKSKRSKRDERKGSKEGEGWKVTAKIFMLGLVCVGALVASFQVQRLGHEAVV